MNGECHPCSGEHADLLSNSFKGESPLPDHIVDIVDAYLIEARGLFKCDW